MLAFYAIKQVKTTTNVNEVNFLLKEGWCLLEVGNHGGTFSYLLGN